jgi:hypothetical protein
VLLRRGRGHGHAGDSDDAAGPPVDHAEVVVEGVKGETGAAQARQCLAHDLAEDADPCEARIAAHLAFGRRTVLDLLAKVFLGQWYADPEGGREGCNERMRIGPFAAAALAGLASVHATR